MVSAISSPPSSFLSGGFVTDTNRNTLWNALSAADQARYSTPASSGSGTTSGSGGTSGSSGTAAAPTFVSRGSTTALASTTFDNRTDARSATPGSNALTGYSKLWDNSTLLAAQLALTTDPGSRGGALFVNITAGTLADGDRPQDGLSGNISNIRGQNPFGYFEPGSGRDNFVRVFSGAETRFEDVNPTGTLAERQAWETTARSRYDSYQTLVSDQITKTAANFGGSQGLLGFDVNKNGKIDDETELFGFDAGLDINGSANILTTTGGSATTNFTFLTGSRLTGDFLDSNRDPAQLDNYRRFLILTSAGQSAPLLQTGSTGFTDAINAYVSTQTRFDLNASGGARLTIVAQNGIGVSATA
jgi:hypothetical protein